MTPRTTPLTALPERSLDVVRAFAVLSVLSDHVMVATLPRAWTHQIAGAIGYFGVLLFFLHTGCVLMGSLERLYGRRHWVAAFLVRRAFRIYPLSIAVVLLLVALGRPEAGHVPGGEVAAAPHSGVAAIMSNLALVQNLAAAPSILGPSWTLPVELQMYVLLPLCFLVARRRSAGVARLFAVFVGAYVVVAYAPLPGAGRLTVFAFGPCFLAGVTTYHLLKRGGRAALPAWVLAAALAAGLAWTAVVLGPARRPLTWLAPILVGVAIPFIREPRASRLTHAARIVCRYSYGIYLFHVPILWLALTRLGDMSSGLRVAIALGMIVVVPVMAYHGLEAPALAWGRRAADRLSAGRTEDDGGATMASRASLPTGDPAAGL